MSSLPSKPKQIKSGLVSDAASGIKRILVLRYNPDTLSRSDQVQSTGCRRIPSQFPGQSPTALPHGIISQPSAPEMSGQISKSKRASYQILQRPSLFRAISRGHRA